MSGLDVAGHKMKLSQRNKISLFSVINFRRHFDHHVDTLQDVQEKKIHAETSIFITK